jgi:hypothetical protein
MVIKDGFRQQVLKLFNRFATILLSLMSDNQRTNQFIQAMKKLLFLSMLILVVFSCKKTEFEPKGPTEVRVKNISDQTFQEIIITIEDEDDTLFKSVAPQGYSDYSRFTTAYKDIEISAKINGVTYTTGRPTYSGQPYLGQVRFTYVVWIKDVATKKLEIYDRIYEEPLVLK